MFKYTLTIGGTTGKTISHTGTCDVCRSKNNTRLVDGKTSIGPWAWMCPECFDKMGVGLGIGKGQQYESEEVIER
jgi:hypothetical protein